ncbi:phage holin family protein [Rhodoflexus caldus]|uniref:phage holin family protein n=1 Tax=Rhodoflexus caldus TaxID=2891236 RepID=UPI00202AA1E9|nr:phage holin family protein [Rhodoflexus caldus]
MSAIINFLVYAAAVYITAFIVPGIKIKSFGTAVIAGLLLILARYTIEPILVLLTLPVTILTLGLFLIVINAFIVQIVAAVLDDFKVEGFIPAIIYSIALSVVGTVLQWIFQ